LAQSVLGRGTREQLDHRTEIGQFEFERFEAHLQNLMVFVACHCDAFELQLIHVFSQNVALFLFTSKYYLFIQPNEISDNLSLGRPIVDLFNVFNLIKQRL
jgi:hypothetical protein